MRIFLLSVFLITSCAIGLMRKEDREERTTFRGAVGICDNDGTCASVRTFRREDGTLCVVVKGEKGKDGSGDGGDAISCGGAVATGGVGGISIGSGKVILEWKE